MSMVAMTEITPQEFDPDTLDVPARQKRNRRALRLDPMATPTPLLGAYTLPEADKQAIQFACLTYLWHCARAGGQPLPMPNGPEWFRDHEAALGGLPNVTPNGLVLPKRETVSSYNLVHGVVAEILGKHLDRDRVAAIHAPINIRLVNGEPNPRIDSRPRASTKIHSDIWAAEPANTMAFFLPVLGSTEASSVEFIEPVAFPASFQRPLDDFSLGAFLADGGTVYPPVFAQCDMLTMDTLCLHRTIKSGGGFRLSIDFRILHADTLPGDHLRKSPRLQNYVSPEIWEDIGKSYMLVCRTPIRRAFTDQVSDGYADRYDISGL